MSFAPNSIILYVNDVEASTEFYSSILGAGPVEVFPGFALFALGGGFTIGLQTKHDIEPAPQPSFGGFEIDMSETDRQTVDTLYAEWKELGIAIAQEPTEMDFGYTFVATDLDGHRLRVCATHAPGIE